MAKVKKFKISAAKRAQHLKSKKKITKVQPNKNQKPADLAKGNKSAHNLFGRKKTNAKEKRNKPKRHLDNRNSDDENNEEIVDGIQDCLDENDEYNNKFNGNHNEKKKSRKRKYQQDEQIDSESKLLEKLYTNQTNNENADKTIEIGLLPIKSKDGEIIARSTQIDYVPDSENLNENDMEIIENDDDEYQDSDDDIIQDNEQQNQIDNTNKFLSTTDLLILREQEIERQKYRIGVICSGILEKPEDKMQNLSALFHLMDEQNENDIDNLFIIRKIACISICEIFKDILPEYRVGQVDPKMTTIRKSTLERITYENAMLQQFKRFLQKLEKITSYVTKKQSNPNRNNLKAQTNIKMGAVAVQCLCDLLISHSYFNYVQNIGQLLVYILNCNYKNMREMANECFSNIFRNDQRFDMILYIVRRINHLIKTKSNQVHVEVITCLMSLKKLKTINLDAEKENELKQKKLENHRQRLLSLSKKEKKRRKRLTELNRELQETQAEENKQTKHHKLTEIIKMIFTIYFRILKNQPNSKLLSYCLEGLAEFAHMINIEIFSDLIEILNDLLEENNLGYREQLHCIQTIFTILSGQGQVLNIDPIRFYGHLYRNLLIINAGKNHKDFQIILNTLNHVLIKNRKNMTQQRLLAFVKRIITISLYLLHNGTLSCLCIIKNIMQLTSMLDIILDMDSSIGSGQYDPELNDPEYCNASSSALYELSILQRHYHSTVRKMALNIGCGVPASGDGSLPAVLSKLTAVELFEQFDSTKMAFNPSILIPNKNEPKIKKGRLIPLNPDLFRYCKDNVKQHKLLMRKNRNTNNELKMDFYQDLINSKCEM